MFFLSPSFLLSDTDWFVLFISLKGFKSFSLGSGSTDDLLLVMIYVYLGSYGWDVAEPAVLWFIL